MNRNASSIITILLIMFGLFGLFLYINKLSVENTKLVAKVDSLEIAKGQVTIKLLDSYAKADSLKVMVNDFSETLTAYQQLLKEVGVLVQRQCPEMFKEREKHPPSLRRPQSLPDPDDIPQPTPKVDI